MRDKLVNSWQLLKIDALSIQSLLKYCRGKAIPYGCLGRCIVMKRILLLATVVNLLAFVGCGSGTVNVGGIVTLDGEPLADAEVLFEPKDGGRSSIGVTDQQGRYELKYTGDKKGCIPGDYVVRISTAAHQPIGPDGDPIISPERVSAEFHANSQLTATVSSGVGSYDFDVKPN